MLSHKKWEEFCKEIQHTNTILAHEIKNSNEPWVIIKHDVETNPKAALEIAKIENKYGIEATFYVQGYLISGNVKIFKEIESLGHEVTYHYDVLDANSGDFGKAKKEFKEYLDAFSKAGFKVKTVCPHGNPLMKREGWSSNRDFFECPEVRSEFPDILDIVVDIESISNEFIYISDAGYGFNEILDISGKDKNKLHKSKPIDILRISEIIMQKSVVISTHPHRWFKYEALFIFRKSFFQFAKRIARFFYKFPLLRVIISKLFFLAKKI